ncbi:MAG: hypothetical protein A3B31_02820 [Candidatus Komeilibacteria bacterium RIFCSPLOWO2_01_FULL_53_11]|uniref:DUF378 domain-containing protein n=1 Tax=Candidatus Komeilibacteria bacterium RIFCSPLOWO2_01_FULL_53_11 TaxID=1798552 RepID=A0A1G2BVF3_9BACT|nr:MAG: hypothetical protein A3B31_02820 [Candidatus Komeilibacteria bacterium RIFCSPLOWO2_01_FULL_53_11]
MHKITFILLVIGGLNWLVFGLSLWDIGQLFGGAEAMISRVIYVVVGLAAVYEIATHTANCRACTEKKPATTGSMPTGM